MHDYDIIIIGGGMVGQAFALSMANTKFKIAIIEPFEPNPTIHEQYHLRVSAITTKSEKFLQNIGAWELIKRKLEFNKTKIWEQNSHGKIDFDKSNTSHGHLGHIIENDCIKSALFNALKQFKINFIANKLNAIKKTPSGYQINLNDNTKLSCSLLVGADGVNSHVRNMANIAVKEKNYQQKAIICNITSNIDFQNTTWQRFLSDSIIAILPLNSKQASIVWSADNTLADELINLSNAEFSQRLSHGLEYKFGALQVVSDIKAFALVAHSANTYVKENLALIGDAAHSIHPLAGQGANLGFADAMELAKQLQTNIHTEAGNYQVLRKYARARRLDNELMAKTMSALNWVYKENNEIIRWGRGFGMNFINNNNAIKRFLQNMASGS